MKVLLIGGTGRISAAISRKLIKDGHDLYLLNRGNRNDFLGTDKAKYIIADINDVAAVAKALGEHEFDAVADFIVFKKEHLERDYKLFKDRTKQFIFISSASAYQKPIAQYPITEGSAVSNQYWQYSADKIECEKYLMDIYRSEGFPVTIVRPSHTYDERAVPVGVHGNNGSWQVARRMLEGKPVIVHGDGTSLWVMTSSKDFAIGFVGLIGNTHAIGETYHITSDEILSWNQIYQATANALGVKPNLRHVSSELLAECSNYDFYGGLLGDKAHSLLFDNSKIKRAVPEFVCTTRFDRGIKETVDYVLAHPEYQLIDENFDAWCDRVIRALDEVHECVEK